MHVCTVDMESGRLIEPLPVVRLRFRVAASVIVDGRERMVTLISDDEAELALLEPGQEYVAELTPAPPSTAAAASPE